jgi:Flp pilus assembly protein TadB
MMPSVRLKLGAAFFAVFWTVGMICWGGSCSPASIVITTIAGVLAAYLWYRLMRWQMPRGRVPREP